MALEEPEHVPTTRTYAKMLQGPQDSDDEDQRRMKRMTMVLERPMTPAEYAERKQARRARRRKSSDPSVQEESTSVNRAMVQQSCYGRELPNLPPQHRTVELCRRREAWTQRTVDLRWNRK
jgi:hypothetical protein